MRLRKAYPENPCTLVLGSVNKLRTGAAALPEMRAVANKIKDIMAEKAPKIFGNP